MEDSSEINGEIIQEADSKPETDLNENMKEWIRKEYPYSFQTIMSAHGEEILEIKILDIDSNGEQQKNGIFSKKSEYDKVTDLVRQSSHTLKPYIESMLSAEGGLYISNQGITSLERCCKEMRELIESKDIPFHYLANYTLRDYNNLPERDKEIFKKVLGYVNSRNEKVIKEGEVSELSV